MPGLGSGRHFINMETQPSSKGKAIFDSRQNVITDQDSVYSKDGMQSPGQSLSTNENPVSVQKMSSVNDVSETGNSPVAIDCLPSTSGKAADERESNFRQQKYSYVKDTEDTISKSLCISPVKGAGTIDIGTSSVCMSASIEIGKQYVVCKDGESHDTYMFHGPCMNSQAVQECSIGKGLFSSTLEKPEKQAKQEVTREQGKHMFHKVVTGSGPENIKIESFNHINSNESLLKRELQKGALFVDNGVHLTEILEELASLDQNGFFSNPMDNSSAVDHSNINRSNICFSVMHEKIQLKDYKTWRSFVDDFEDICHNAMNKQEKGSMIWEAANTLLYKGKQYLEQYADRAITFFGLLTKVEHRSSCGLEASNNGHCKVENTVRQEGECSFSKGNKELGPALNGKHNNLAFQKSVNVLGSSDMTVPPPDENFQNVSGSTLLCTQNMVYVQEQDECMSNSEPFFDTIEANVQVDDSIVEILDCIGDGIRFNPSNQATECSSSFGDTELDIDDDDDSGCKMYDAAEAESDLRNGNGAAIAAEDDSGGFRKRKKALRDEWKDHRRRIEWRCQWLELRVKELQSQSLKYDRILADIQARKVQKGGHATDFLTSRSSPQIDQTYRHRVIQRKRRKKVESTVDFSAYMSHHPLFSLYEKKRLDAEAVPLDDDCYSILSAGEVNDAGLNENDSEGPLTGPEYKNGDNSMEHMLVHIETLQSRVLKMKNQLNKFYSRKVGSPRNISSSFLTADLSKSVLQSTAPSRGDSSRMQTTVGGGSKLHTETNLPHQQNFDLEFSNSVMPCNGTSSYVESAHQDIIETPDWRLLGNGAMLDQPEKEDSSDEVTDEEAYKEHHALMEVKEKKHREFPFRGTKHFEGESILSKGTSQRQTTEVIERDVGQTGGENISNICLPFDLFVPKCKRKKAHSRSSSLQKVEGLHALNVEDPNSSSLQDRDMNEVKMENKEDPLGDEIRDDL